jgi:hypothetical protein
MEFRLGDVNGWKEDVCCVVVMLCAVSGKTPQEIAKVLQQAAAECGDTISEDLRRDYNIKHWLQAVKTLGGEYTISLDLVQVPYEQRPTIDSYLGSHTSGQLEVVYCDDPKCKDSHVFATEAGQIVDTYTAGRKVTKHPVPADYAGFHVKGVFLLSAS